MLHVGSRGANARSRQRPHAGQGQGTCRMGGRGRAVGSSLGRKRWAWVVIWTLKRVKAPQERLRDQVNPRQSKGLHEIEFE
ncbi:hypothetical protein J5N97_022618 [Dioscorea zingiberensis]|uniref:Uncharacterized protein n=1 Tax=Dioscorea zingiberensis TaxID=325984 RepID=A0A9D5CAG6_9LILI|nr:hypothetical protein J5N97_022618 [Dioscorea zingiberensis]